MFFRLFLRRFSLRSIARPVLQLLLLTVMMTGYLIPQVYAAAFDSTGAFAIDPAFTQTGTGLNGVVYSIARQPDGKILAAGSFTTYDGVAAKYLIRLNADGTRDGGFNQTGTGLSSSVRGIALQSDGKILATGQFTSYNGATAVRIIRLNADGTRDGGFITGTGIYGAANLPYTIVLQTDGKILIGGVFLMYNGVSARYLVRLNADGTRDGGFNQTGTGPGGYVHTITLQPDGKILIGGSFTTYNGVSAKYLVRLNTDGTHDSAFAQTGTGLSSAVYNIISQPDGKILIGGSFTTYNGSAVPYITSIQIPSFCSTVTGIPTVECYALKNIYTNTG